MPDFVAYASSRNIQYEIIIVDDGSNDNGETEQVARDLKCIFLKNERNGGKGAAVRKGMLHAKGNYRIFTDADFPFEFETIERFLHYLQVKEFDVVIGDRTLPGSVYFSEISQTRKISSNIFSFFVGRFVTTGIYDTQCGLKGFSAKAAEDIFTVARVNRFAFDVELLYISFKRNYDIKRLPLKLRCNEKSSVSVLLDGMNMVFDLFAIKWNHLIGRYKPLK